MSSRSQLPGAGGMHSGVVVLDRELRVVAWNPRAEDLWGRRADEVQSENFLSLDIGLPTEQLRSGIRACLRTGAAAPSPAG